MRTYPGKIVVKVTGIRLDLLRQWDVRNLYICDLRRKSETDEQVELHFPFDADGAKKRSYEQDAEALKEKINTGWREFTFRDLVHLTVLRMCTEMGVSVKEAAFIAGRVPVSNEEHERSVAELEAASGNDGPQFFYWSPQRPLFTRGLTHDRGRLAEGLSESRLSLVLNLTDIRRSVIAALDKALAEEA